MHDREQRRRADADRPNSAQRLYSWAWRQYAKRFLLAHPLCAECERAGRVTAATVVDHVVPHKGDLALFWDPGNHEAKCKPCHDRKTATRDGGFGRDRSP